MEGCTKDFVSAVSTDKAHDDWEFMVTILNKKLLIKNWMIKDL